MKPRVNFQATINDRAMTIYPHQRRGTVMTNFEIQLVIIWVRRNMDDKDVYRDKKYVSHLNVPMTDVWFRLIVLLANSPRA